MPNSDDIQDREDAELCRTLRVIAHSMGYQAPEQAAIRIEAMQAALRAAAIPREPVAWMRADGEDGSISTMTVCISSRIRDIWLKANPRQVERYTIPLYDAAPAKGEPAVEDAELCMRLMAASHDERLSTGMLYREAADRIEALAAQVAALNQPVKLSEWQELQRRAERAEAEIARLKVCVRAADKWAGGHIEYDAARRALDA